MTELQREIHEMAEQNRLEMEAALRRETTHDGAEQCRDAYHHIYRCKLDVISQRHGMEPMLWPAP